MLTADDVLRVRFTATRLRPGYDQVEVDDLLDHVVATLRHGSAPGTLTAADVAGATLRTRTLAEGYDIEQVDAFLAEVRATLAERETAHETARGAGCGSRCTAGGAT